ncbi:hypothetical protein H0N98_02505 [Candidatus Micrarchaeota archaeon]|nr:hypothetical protein [Candidatus Micrarchaeota archaeon]
MMVIVKSYFALKFVNPSILPDEAVYSSIAKNIPSGKFTSGIQFTETYPPGYPLFLAIANVSADADIAYHVMQIINCILSSSIIFPAFFTLKKFIGEEEALYFSFAVSCIPSVAIYFPFLMSENLFSPLFLFSACFLLESTSRKTPLFDFLSGFSVFFLFLTRTIGFAMIPGLLIALAYRVRLSKDRKYPTILKSEGLMLLSFVLPFFVWYYYKANNPVPQLSVQELSDASGGYAISIYLATLNAALSSMPSFLNFLTLLIHEIDYMTLTTYLAFLIFAVYSIYRWSFLERKHEFLIFASYTSISLILTIFITLVHMYHAVTHGLDYYTIFGRYLDPLVAPIFMMGVVGFYQFQKNKERKSSLVITDSYLLAGLCLLLLITFAYTFPYDARFFEANLVAISYLASPDFHPLLSILAGLFIFSFMLIIPKNSTLIKTLLVLLIMTSVMFNSAIILVPTINPASVEDVYHIARYLQKSASADTLTLFDSEVLDYDQSFVWFPINFWSKSRLMLYPLNNSHACPDLKADYLISNKTLSYPYKNVTSDGAYSLYNIKSC